MALIFNGPGLQAGLRGRMCNIVWFREDLRIHDNNALYHASLHSQGRILGLFVIDRTMWHKHHMAACRVDFILQGLKALSLSLAKLNIPLLLIEVSDSTKTAEEIYKLMDQHKALALFFNKQYEFDELKRDSHVAEYLEAKSMECYSYDDQLILTPGSIRTKQGDYFKVFTPFKRAWINAYRERTTVKILAAPKAQKPTNIKSSVIPDKIIGFNSKINPKYWPGGEKNAEKALDQFINSRLFDYDKQRDFPAIMGTSRLSPYLASGMISARQCMLAAVEENKHQLDSGNKGALCWMGELIWREFYKTILMSTPRVSMSQAYQTSTDQIKWDFNEIHFTAWKDGRTGYPLIDAAMRQLSQTGWMHNRLRMVTAMFLVKNLFFDWRLGEAYFMSQLIDGDLAANNGGWQWCASTGTDAAPYFRIFNPITQSKNFDPEGKFIRHYCPELAQLSNKEIHEPHRKPSITIDYPKPIIELHAKRTKVLAAYSCGRKPSIPSLKS